MWLLISNFVNTNDIVAVGACMAGFFQAISTE